MEKNIEILNKWQYLLPSLKSYFLNKKYEPGKSFEYLRYSSKKIESINKRRALIFKILLEVFLVVVVLGVGIYIVTNTSIDPEKIGRLGGKFIFFTVAPLYYPIKAAIKAIKIHENVDYVAITSYEKFIDLEIDEKVIASYQNFDATDSKYKNGYYILLVTSRRLYFASYKQKAWRSLLKRLDEIQAISISNGFFIGAIAKRNLQLRFVDNTSLSIWMDMRKKLTSNPDLFLKSFLETIDAMLCGDNEITRVRRRRTVSEIDSHESTKAENKILETKTQDVTIQSGRELDLSILLNDIKDAESYATGRHIEL